MTLPADNGDGELDPKTVAELRQLARVYGGIGSGRGWRAACRDLCPQGSLCPDSSLNTREPIQNARSLDGGRLEDGVARSRGRPVGDGGRKR
jgi:hypothetical protein